MFRFLFFAQVWYQGHSKVMESNRVYITLSWWYLEKLPLKYKVAEIGNTYVAHKYLKSKFLVTPQHCLFPTAETQLIAENAGLRCSHVLQREQDVTSCIVSWKTQRLREMLRCCSRAFWKTWGWFHLNVTVINAVSMMLQPSYLSYLKSSIEDTVNVCWGTNVKPAHTHTLTHTLCLSLTHTHTHTHTAQRI